MRVLACVLLMLLSRGAWGDPLTVTADVPGQLWVRTYRSPAEAPKAPLLSTHLRTPCRIELAPNRYYDLVVQARTGLFRLRRGSYPRVVDGASAVAIQTEPRWDWFRLSLVIMLGGVGVGFGLLARNRRLSLTAIAADTRARRAEARGGDPTRIGPYHITGRLGRGGMGTVYLVSDEHGDQYALKVSQGGDRRFLREWEILRHCRHPSVVRIYDYHAGDDVCPPYLVMEKIDGETLGDRLSRQFQLPLQQAVAIARNLLEALAELHGRGVIHRDLKPDNLFLIPGGGVKVVDFGVSKWTSQEALTLSGEMLGTPAYAAPEQLESKHADERSDLYAVGVMLYQMTTGRLPWESTDPVGTFLAKAKGLQIPPQQLNPTLPPRLAQLIVDLLAVDPAARPGSAGQVLERLG